MTNKQVIQYWRGQGITKSGEFHQVTKWNGKPRVRTVKVALKRHRALASELGNYGAKA